MTIPSDIVRGMTYLARLARGAEEPPRVPPRVSLEQPRPGRDLSRLPEQGTGVTPLQHAVTTVAGLVVPAHQAVDGESPLSRPVNKDSLKDYVRASLGMAYTEAKVDGELAPYLDELSKVESMDSAQPVTKSSFTLLCTLYMADQVPGSAEYGQLNRDAFMRWLGEKLDPDRPGYDCIPASYFDMVQVSRTPETSFTTGFTVQYGRDRAVDVPTMHLAELPSTDLPRLQSAHLPSADLQGANLRGADLQGADLRGVDVHGANLRGGVLHGPGLRGPHQQGDDLRRTFLERRAEELGSGRQLPRHEGGPDARGGRRSG